MDQNTNQIQKQNQPYYYTIYRSVDDPEVIFVIGEYDPNNSRHFKTQKEALAKLFDFHIEKIKEISQKLSENEPIIDVCYHKMYLVQTDVISNGEIKYKCCHCGKIMYDEKKYFSTPTVRQIK